MNPFRAAIGMTAPRAFFGNTGAYQGAQQSRHTADWNPGILSPDQEIGPGLRVLRARSRDMHRNSAHGTGFTRDLRDNVVGVEEGGIRLQARNRYSDGRTLTGFTSEFNKDLNDHLEARWVAWGEPEVCSADGRSSWADLQRLYITTLAVDGEVLWRELPGFDNAFGYAVEILDADQIDETLNRPRSEGQNEIRYGVEVDRYNRPVAYWMWQGHPSEWAKRKERTRVSAEFVHLDFIQLRPGQTRGVPWLSPVLFLWRHWEGFTQAEVMQARAAACMGGFFTATGTDADMWLPTSGKPNEKGEPIAMSMEPNLYRMLPPGLKLDNVEPTHPNPNAPEFRRDILMTLAKGLGPSFTTTSGDFSNTNYSSGRMGLLPERDFFRACARFETRRFHRLVYRGWLNASALNGAIAVPSQDPATYSAHKWEYRGWPWIDPLNDAQAKELMLALGLTTPQKMCAELGVDFEENLEELKEAKRLAAEYGVEVGPSQTRPNPRHDGPPEPTNGNGKNGNGNGNGSKEKTSALMHRLELLEAMK